MQAQGNKNLSPSFHTLIEGFLLAASMFDQAIQRASNATQSGVGI